MKFEFYVLNYNVNRGCVENFNIFQNNRVQDETEKAVKQYVDSNNITFEALCEEIKHIIMHEEWSRRQYEISVGDAFEEDISKYEKWNCYAQAVPNIAIITRECIYQYIHQREEN